MLPVWMTGLYLLNRPLPIVSLGRLSMEGYPYVQSGGDAGMRKAIVHLIEVHNRCRIAFIKGLPNYRPHTETIYV